MHNNKAQVLQQGWFFQCNVSQKSSELNQIEEAHNIQAQGRQELNCVFWVFCGANTNKKY